MKDKQRLEKVFNTQISTFTTSVTPCCLTIHIPYHSLGLATYYMSSSSFVEIFWNPASEDDIQLRTSVCLEMRWFLLDYIWSWCFFDTQTHLSRWKSPCMIYSESQVKVNTCKNFILFVLPSCKSPVPDNSSSPSLTTFSEKRIKGALISLSHLQQLLDMSFPRRRPQHES